MSRKRIPDKNEYKAIKLRVHQMVEVGFIEDGLSRSYDFVNLLAIALNLVAATMLTFDGLTQRFGGFLGAVEAVTVFFFMIDYFLRLWTSDLLYPGRGKAEACARYAFSFAGIVDLLSFLPYYLPVFFPAGAVAFRMFRVMRIFRLFRVNAYYDSLNVITEVIKAKRQQLLSSVFIIAVLMLASSLCMYSLEHPAQPDVFENAFSGIWWATSTLLTVGYGDIYPITPMGRLMGIVIAFLGVGIVAIPTGIISAGFVEQYTHMRETGPGGDGEGVSFIRFKLTDDDPWTGRAVGSLDIPGHVLVAAVQRGRKVLAPKKDLVLAAGDSIVLGAEGVEDEWDISLKELVLFHDHPFVGRELRDLDLSRQSFIVGIRRGASLLIPGPDTLLRENDVLILYTRKRIAEATTLEL